MRPGFDLAFGSSKMEAKETVLNREEASGRFQSTRSLESKVQMLQNRIEALEADALAKEKEEALLANQFVASVDSIIGLREVIETKQPVLKFTWILLVSVGFASTAYFMYATIQEYIANPWLTKVSLNAESEYFYPPLVLCNHRWLDLDKAEKMGLSMDGLIYSLGFMDRSRIPQETITNLSQARQNFHHVFNKHNFSSLSAFFEHLAIKLEPTVSKQEFYNISSPAYFIEDVESVQLVFGASGGVCHAFNFHPLDGKSGSLVVPLELHVKYANQGDTFQWLLYFVEGAAARYWLPVIAPSSARNNLRIQSQLFKSFNTPDHVCSENPFGNYAPAGCMANCQGDFYMKQFGCRHFYMATGEKQQLLPSEYCNFHDQSRMRILDGHFKDTCYSRCPRYCTRLTYEASLEGVSKSYDYFFGEEEEKLVRAQNMSVTTFNILHDAMRQGGLVTFLEVESYSLAELANNVGGTLGLFVGSAILTFAQLLLFLVTYFGQWIHTNWRQK